VWSPPDPGKGVEGYVGLFGLGLRGEGGSAVPTKRKREPQAMWRGTGKVQMVVVCCLTD